ncbi:MAG: metallophosphoesterase family protein [Planctomycetia bacterium]|nr:metallophosphoesterase family protein [Planctomycetia bacterium]
MIIAVMSDTHGNDNLVRKAVRTCKQRGVERIIHCGDIGQGTTVELFREIPTNFVFGNCDGEYTRRVFRDLIPSCNGTLHDEEFGSLNLQDIPIAFTHGCNQRVLDDLIDSCDWRLVCSGHIHELQCENRVYRNPEDESDPQNGHITTHLVPGSLFQPRGEKRFLGFCLVYLPEMRFEAISLIGKE